MSFMKHAILAIALATAAPAGAQDSERTGLARDMLVAMRAADNFDAVIPAVLQALKPGLTAGNPKASKDWDEIAPLMIQELSAMKASLLDEIAVIYAKAFDSAELRQFVAFYKSPAGDKLARLTPVLAQQTMGAGQKFGQQVAARIAERMRDELRKRGNTL